MSKDPVSPWHPSLVLYPEPTIAYYPDDDYRTISGDLPDHSQLYATAGSYQPVKTLIPAGKKSMMRISPINLWKGIPPAEAHLEYMDQFGFFHETPAGCARQLIRQSLKGIPLFAHNGYTRRLDLVEAFSTSYFLGPVMRHMESRIDNAVMIDLNAAYLDALCQPLPQGPPFVWSGRQVPTGCAGLVAGPVRDRYRLHGERQPDGSFDYPLEYTYKGTWLELSAGIQAGRLELLGDLQGWIFDQGQMGASIWELLQPWMESTDPERGPVQRKLAKMAYTHGWVTHVWPGYQRGYVQRDITLIPEGYRTQPGMSHIHWKASSIDPDIEARMRQTIQRPDRSAHVAAYVRIKVQDVAQRIVDAGGQIGQILVDAIICSADHLPADLDIGSRPGQWRIASSDDKQLECKGQYHGMTPGRYQFKAVNPATGRLKVIRDKHAGLAGGMTWEALEAAIGD